MIAPNLASRPHLNTRPVWVVTAVAAALALAFAGANVWVWVSSSRELAEQLARQEQLEAEHRRLAAEVGERVEGLNRVPWRSLAGKINAADAGVTAYVSTTSSGPCPTR